MRRGGSERPSAESTGVRSLEVLDTVDSTKLARPDRKRARVTTLVTANQSFLRRGTASLTRQV